MLTKKWKKPKFVIKDLNGNPFYVEYIKNPTINQQIVALTINPHVLSLIKNPSLE